MNPQHRQADYRVRFDWGPTGAAAIAAGADVAVVVDVLSFTTTLTVAVERGITVWPFPWKDERAAAYAEERDATLAVGRFEARDGPGDAVSLSPAAMTRVDGVERLVLPSPNGSTICARLAGSGTRGGRGLPAQPHRRRASARPSRDDDDRGRRRRRALAGRIAAAVRRGPLGRGCGARGRSSTTASTGSARRPGWPPRRFRTIEAAVLDSLRECAGGRELSRRRLRRRTSRWRRWPTSAMVVPVLGDDGGFRAG